MVTGCLSEVCLIEIEDKLEEAVHLVLLNDACLADRTHYLQERLPLVSLKLLDRYVRHIDDHNVVAEIGFVETNLGLVQLSPCLFYFG